MIRSNYEIQQLFHPLSLILKRQNVTKRLFEKHLKRQNVVLN